MASAGVQKAALLLMSLEPATAAELLKAAEPDMVTRIAAELAYLQASGSAGKGVSQEPVREFFQQLREQTGGGQGVKFIRRMLEGAVGTERSREIMEQISLMVDQRDPFLPIRSADPESIAEALAGESPQVAGMVLAELPPKLSAKLLPLLNDDVRAEAVRGMTSEVAASVDARMRVAAVVRERLLEKRSGGGSARSQRQAQLRRVALLLRGLGSDLRGTLLETIGEKDKEVSNRVQELMVIWEDVPVISDRSLQEALRAVDLPKLAMALVNADEATTNKVRGNLSQRQIALLDEEATLISQPGETDIEQARDELLKALRDLAGSNFLTFDDD
ncbi:MAG TPA: FliG C-terminal domain-containing protein [Phycisphaerae bacterium]|nr:FliG C-terminal domain-containing protein [Phycisphaerae bacterium]